MDFGPAMQLTEGHSTNDNLFKIPFSIAERPKKDKVKEEAISIPNELELELNESQDTIERFIIDTLNNNNPKDKLHMIKIEKELIVFLKSECMQILKFPEMSSYNRMLVHKVAAHFGLDHNVDLIGNSVIVSKTWKSQIPDKRFQDHINELKFNIEESNQCIIDPPKRSILKRNMCEPVVIKEFSSEKSLKTLEEREEEYQQARARIFQDTCLNNNLLAYETGTNEILEAIDENLTKDEREMLTIPDINKQLSKEEKENLPIYEIKDDKIAQHQNNLDVNLSQCISETKDLICAEDGNIDKRPLINNLIDFKETNKAETQNRKPKKCKSKGNIQVNENAQNCKNINNPQSVSPLLESLSLSDTKNHCTTTNFGFLQQNVGHSNYYPSHNLNSYKYNISGRDYVISTTQPYLNQFLSSNTLNAYVSTMQQQLNIKPDIYTNFGLEAQTSEHNYIYPTYHSQKNLGASILPIPTAQSFPQAPAQYSNIYSGKFPPAPTSSYHYKQPQPLLNPSLSAAIHHSWQSGINSHNLASQVNVPVLGHGSLTNIHTNASFTSNPGKMGIFQDPPSLFPYNSPSTMNQVESKANNTQLPLIGLPLPHYLNNLNKHTFPQSVLKYNNYLVTLNNPTLQVLNPVKNTYAPQPPGNLASSSYTNLAPMMKYPTLQYPLQQPIPAYKQYGALYPNSHPIANAALGNGNLPNKALVPPPLMNQMLLPTNCQNAYSKLPVPLMTQNVVAMGMQQKCQKSNTYSHSTLQQDIIKFQNAMGIHKPQYHNPPIYNQNMNNKPGGRGAKYNRTQNEHKKQISTPKTVHKISEEPCDVASFGTETIKVLKKDSSKTSLQPPSLFDVIKPVASTDTSFNDLGKGDKTNHAS